MNTEESHKDDSKTKNTFKIKFVSGTIVGLILGLILGFAIAYVMIDKACQTKERNDIDKEKK